MRCKQFIIVSLAGVVLAASLAGCGGAVPASSAAASSVASSSVMVSSAAAETALPDGVYTADAEANKTAWLIPTVDTVTYADGTTEEVYGYDIPVEALDTDFQLALLGTKGKWYDHTVSVRNAEPKTEQAVETPADGAYTAAVVLEGGSGRATVESPAALTVAEGKMTATIVWSSPNYDYMIVDGEKYLPTNTEGNSTFEIPVAALGTPLTVTADTVAMSKPHEIEYTLTFTLE